MTEPTPPGKNRSTRILERVCAGDSQAANELLPVVYGELRKLAPAENAFGIVTSNNLELVLGF